MLFNGKPNHFLEGTSFLELEYFPQPLYQQHPGERVEHDLPGLQMVEGSVEVHPNIIEEVHHHAPWSAVECIHL